MNPSANQKDFLRESNKQIVKKRRSRRSKITIFFGILFVLLLVGTVFFLRLQKFLITTVTVSGEVVVEESAVQKIVGDRLSGKYLWIIPRSNSLLLSTNNLEKRLKRMIPRISSVEIDHVGLKGLSVNIKEYSSEYIWCGSDVVPLGVNSDSQCLFMDKSGYLFGYAPYISGSVYTVLYGREIKTPGHFGFEKENFDKITLLLLNMKTLGLDVTNVVEEEDNDFSFYVKDNKNATTEIKVSLNDDASTISNHLSSVLASEVFKDRNNVFNMLYIDLRFGNKVFYKAK